MVAIDEEGKLVYDGFIWDIDFQTCDISRCAADIKDFMNGVNAARGVDPDQAVDDARFKAAAEAANLPDNESKREDGGDNL